MNMEQEQEDNTDGSDSPANEEGVNHASFSSSDDNDSLMSSASPEASISNDVPRPRDHSYLAGISHPLLVDSSISSSEPVHENENFSRTQRYDLPILELDGVVLFPGSTIPVKLRNRALIAYLGHLIEVCRTLPHRQPQVRLGVLTSESRHNTIYARRKNDDGTCVDKGRVGTIATIQYTQERSQHRNEAGDSASLSNPPIWRVYQDTNELVFTAVGTGRFKVQEPASEDGTIWKVEEMPEMTLLKPRLGRLFSSVKTSKQEGKDWRIRRHDFFTWNLSLLTPMPNFVYASHWPWKIVDELILLLQKNQGRSNLPHFGDPDEGDKSNNYFKRNSPTSFSYWLASNMPFTQNERLELLREPSVLERLRRIREKILDLVHEQDTCYLGCDRCGIPICPVEQIFSFDGAEGATSNYVNNHGYIHQITTLRSVIDERRLYFQGPPSTENS